MSEIPFMPASFLDDGAKDEETQHYASTRSSSAFHEFAIPADDDSLSNSPPDELELFAAADARELLTFRRQSGEVAALYRLYDYACEVERAGEVINNRYTYPVEDRPGEERVKMAENVKAFAERGFTLVLQELRAAGVLPRRVTSDYLPFSGKTSCGAAAAALRREEDERPPAHHDVECLSFWVRRYALFLAGVGVSLLVMGMMLGQIMDRMSSSSVRSSAASRYEPWKGNRSAESAGAVTVPLSASSVAGAIDERLRVPGGMSEADEDVETKEESSGKVKAIKEAKEIFNRGHKSGVR